MTIDRDKLIERLRIDLGSVTVYPKLNDWDQMYLVVAGFSFLSNLGPQLKLRFLVWDETVIGKTLGERDNYLEKESVERIADQIIQWVKES